MSWLEIQRRELNGFLGGFQSTHRRDSIMCLPVINGLGVITESHFPFFYRIKEWFGLKVTFKGNLAQCSEQEHL